MNKNRYQLMIVMVCIFQSMIGFTQGQVTKQYIEKWKEEAINQMKLHKVPASITLAQGILESGNGRSNLARLANNHFGIKCHSSWTGETYYQDDDEKDECFRKYKNAKDSYRDHSLFLKKRRYESLFSLNISDYKGWAKGLKKAGYATNPKYPSLLINLIEKYNLTQYDNLNQKGNIPVIHKDTAKTDVNGMETNFDVIEFGTTHPVSKTANLVPYILIKKGDSYEKLEKELGIRKWQITKYNDLPKKHDLIEGERIFIKPKRCKSKEEVHVVKSGETMRDVSQLYGVKLKKLYRRNNLDQGSEPKPGQKLNLRKRKK